MDWLFDTPLSPLAQVGVFTCTDGPAPSARSHPVWFQVGVRTPRGTGTQELRTEAQTLALECDNLADQVSLS